MLKYISPIGTPSLLALSIALSGDLHAQEPLPPYVQTGNQLAKPFQGLDSVTGKVRSNCLVSQTSDPSLQYGSTKNVHFKLDRIDDLDALSELNGSTSSFGGKYKFLRAAANSENSAAENFSAYHSNIALDKSVTFQVPVSNANELAIQDRIITKYFRDPSNPDLIGFENECGDSYSTGEVRGVRLSIVYSSTTVALRKIQKQSDQSGASLDTGAVGISASKISQSDLDQLSSIGALSTDIVFQSVSASIPNINAPSETINFARSYGNEFATAKNAPLLGYTYEDYTWLLQKQVPGIALWSDSQIGYQHFWTAYKAAAKAYNGYHLILNQDELSKQFLPFDRREVEQYSEYLKRQRDLSLQYLQNCYRDVKAKHIDPRNCSDGYIRESYQSPPKYLPEQIPWKIYVVNMNAGSCPMGSMPFMEVPILLPNSPNLRVQVTGKISYGARMLDWTPLFVLTTGSMPNFIGPRLVGEGQKFVDSKPMFDFSPGRFPNLRVFVAGQDSCDGGFTRNSKGTPAPMAKVFEPLKVPAQNQLPGWDYIMGPH